MTITVLRPEGTSFDWHEARLARDGAAVHKSRSSGDIRVEGGVQHTMTFWVSADPARAPGEKVVMGPMKFVVRDGDAETRLSSDACEAVRLPARAPGG